MGDVLKYKAVEETDADKISSVASDAIKQRHNKRVRSMRDVRLPKEVVASIDSMIEVSDRIQDAWIASLCSGRNQMSMQDMLDFTKAAQTFTRHFTEIPEEGNTYDE